MSLRHDDDYYETPPWLFNKIEQSCGFKFKLDFCASAENTKCIMYLDEQKNALNFDYSMVNSFSPIFCNPPRKNNGKFVNKLYEIWKEYNVDIVMLLCWNDLGNKYGVKLINNILSEKIKIGNIGKVKFYKNGVESKYPSRLTYFCAWFKKQ